MKHLTLQLVDSNIWSSLKFIDQIGYNLGDSTLIRVNFEEFVLRRLIACKLGRRIEFYQVNGPK